jgi:hypothetical protein
MEVAGLMDMIKTGHTNLIPDDLAGVCGDIAILTSAWKSNIALKLMSQEEGRVNVFCSGNVYSETMPTNVITY